MPSEYNNRINVDWDYKDFGILNIMIAKIQTDVFHQYAIKKYGIGCSVLKNDLLFEIQQELDVDLERASSLLTLMVGVNYFKEEKEKLYIANKSGEYFDNSLVRYWLEK